MNAQAVARLAPPDNLGIGWRRWQLVQAWKGWTETAPASAKLVGTVVDAQRRPVVGASIQAHLFAVVLGGWKRSMRLDASRVFEAETTSGGRFQFDGLCKGNYAVEVTAPGRATIRRDVLIGPEPGVTHLELVLGATDVVAGLVRDEAGRPIAGARLELFNRHTIGPDQSTTYPLFEGKRTASTDPEGRFRFAQLLEGRYTLTLGAEGFASQTIEEVAAGSAACDLTMKPARSP